MSENLARLDRLEEELRERVSAVIGLMEEKDLQLEQTGVYDDYAKVFTSYVDLLDSESEANEALKRAVFLIWYAQAEPSCFSGLGILPEQSSCLVYETLESKARSNDLDSELLWMVAFYDGIAEWVFADEKGLPTFRRTVERSDREAWMNELDPKRFAHRGQMGNYWISICGSHAARRRIAEAKGSSQT
jgi:hypothetical protein